MPVTFYDKLMGGFEDVVLTSVYPTKHALRRMKERGISIEEVQKTRPKATLIKEGNILITAFPNNTHHSFGDNISSPIISQNSNNVFTGKVGLSRRLIRHIAYKHFDKLNSFIEGKVFVNEDRLYVKIKSKSEEEIVFMMDIIKKMAELFIEKVNQIYVSSFEMNGKSEEFINNIQSKRKEQNKIPIFFRQGRCYVVSRSDKEIEKLESIVRNQ